MDQHGHQMDSNRFSMEKHQLKGKPKWTNHQQGLLTCLAKKKKTRFVDQVFSCNLLANCLVQLCIMLNTDLVSNDRNAIMPNLGNCFTMQEWECLPVY